MPAGGALTIRTGQANGFVRIEISGSGAGAAAERLPRQFSAFRSGQPQRAWEWACQQPKRS